MRREDRRVVGVIRRPEEDRLGRRRDRRQQGIRPVAHLGVGQRVGRLDLVAMHQRDDRDGLGAWRGVGRDDDQRLLVGVVGVGVPPRAVECPRVERGRPRVLGGETVPGCRRDVREEAPLSSQAWRGDIGVGVVGKGRSGPGTGGLRVERGDGHRREDTSERAGWLLAQRR